MVDQELGLVTVFNGCIYNYQDLREELRGYGYRFFSTSDTEVVAKSYHRWGNRCVDHFFGMFAFAVLERESGRLVLGRDRLGIKPLYLAERPGRLRFASSLPALLAGGDIDTSIDPVALNHYMTFHAVVPAPLTILAGVRKLPPATVRTYEPDGRFSDLTYWSPEHTRQDKYAGMSESDWQDLVLSTLQTAVQRRMVADVPVGVLLSGGIDSSVIVALLADAGQHGLQTFSIGFERVGDREGDEFEFSDLVAKEFDTHHHQLLMPSSTVLDGLDGAVGAMSEPMVSHDCIAFYLLSQAVSQHLTVVQSGQGADELLAGYDWYPPLADVPPEQALEVYAAHFFDRDRATLAKILQPRWMTDNDPSREFAREHLDRPGATTALDKVLRLDSQIMLVDDPVKRVDNMTMAWGLEARTPFLDHQFAEVAAACPPELKLAHGGKGRAEGGVPKGVARGGDRPQEGPFPGPGDHQPGGPLPGTRAGRAGRARGQAAGPVPAGLRRDAAGRSQQEPDHPGFQPALAAGSAGDVAAAARYRLSRCSILPCNRHRDSHCGAARAHRRQGGRPDRRPGGGDRRSGRRLVPVVVPGRRAGRLRHRPVGPAQARSAQPGNGCHSSSAAGVAARRGGRLGRLVAGRAVAGVPGVAERPDPRRIARRPTGRQRCPGAGRDGRPGNGFRRLLDDSAEHLCVLRSPTVKDPERTSAWSTSSPGSCAPSPAAAFSR